MDLQKLAERIKIDLLDAYIFREFSVPIIDAVEPKEEQDAKET
jgi:hypothetical protein